MPQMTGKGTDGGMRQGLSNDPVPPFHANHSIAFPRSTGEGAALALHTLTASGMHALVIRQLPAR